MELIPLIGPLLAKVNDPTVIVLLLLVIFLCYLHIVWRREEREDRKSAFETISENTAALNAVKNALSALTGKAL